MNMKSDVIKSCRGKIQEKLDLRDLPEITIHVRRFDGPNRCGHYRLPWHKDRVDEPAEHMRDSRWFDKAVQQFKENYYHLHHNTRKDIPYEVYLIEPLIRLGNTVIAGGLNWVIMGALKSGEKYAAIKDVEVRSMLRGCSLMTLMTNAEIELAEETGCDFIHTWHFNYISDFVAAVVPELKAGFMFYRGAARDGEYYEDEKCVHLRYYLDRRKMKMKNARVHFKDGKVFESPRNNTEIIDHLRVFVSNHPGKLPGKEIISIEKYME
jgi:hypothetical protein